jgi:hypothetical protein
VMVMSGRNDNDKCLIVTWSMEPGDNKNAMRVSPLFGANISDFLAQKPSQHGLARTRAVVVVWVPAVFGFSFPFWHLLESFTDFLLILARIWIFGGQAQRHMASAYANVTRFKDATGANVHFYRIRPYLHAGRMQIVFSSVEPWVHTPYLKRLTIGVASPTMMGSCHHQAPA